MRTDDGLDLTPSSKEWSDFGYSLKVGQTEFTDKNQQCLRDFLSEQLDEWNSHY